MAVLPAYQRRGIGSQLVEAGLTACYHTPYGVVVVLGHPHYYSRFGFTPAKPHGIVWEHDAPDAAFMVQEIQKGALAQMRGVIKYHPEFAMVSSEEEAIMPAQHDSLALLQTPVAQALLQSTIPARLAYTGRDGTPRVLPIWFHWTGEVFVLGTRLDSGKVKALSTYPTVALTIDTESFPYQALQVRGTIEIETINGIVPEYELCAKRYLGEKRGQVWIAQLRQAFPPMARVIMRPEWVGILDVAQLYPHVVEAVMAAE